MIPEIAYLAAYTLVCDEKIYDEAWVMLEQFVEQIALDEECKKKVLAIIGDTDNKPSLNDILQTLNNTSSEEQHNAIYLSIKIAYADGLYTIREKEFIHNVARIIGIRKNTLKEFEEEASVMFKNDDRIEISKRKKGAQFYKFLSHFGSKQFSEHMMNRYNKCLLSGTDYADVIKKMRIIAAEDIVFARKATMSLTDLLKVFNQHLNSRSSSIKGDYEKLSIDIKKKLVDVEKQLDNLKNSASLLSDELQKETQETLKKKEESIDRYTISFMGRTKAGKSTLHSVILGGINREFIGKGMERTTRYNRVYQWNGIRIIDTPGIGAPGGKSDTDIAKSVIEESDMICYLVTTDSIQETEFNFLAELKNQNKPVIILLNKKENFDRTQSSREKFLKDPLFWYNRKDKDDIQGHIDRITEYVKKHFTNVYLKIYPVQLKAAQLALSEDNPTLKKRYLEGSRLYQFLDEIRLQILQVGTLKRSQTILNGTLFRLFDCSEKLSAHHTLLKEVKETYDSKGDELIRKIGKAGVDAKNNLKMGMTAVFNSFINNDLFEFAQENYNTKENELENRLKHFIKSKGFEELLKTRIEKEIEDYKAQVLEILTTFKEDLEFTFDSMEINDIAIGGIFDTKFTFKIIGSLMGVAGLIMGLSNPIGWAITGIGLIIGALSMLFKSKEEKIQQAKEKLYDSLSSKLLKHKEDTIQDIVSKFNIIHTNVKNNIKLIFSSLSMGMGEIIEYMNPLMETTDINEMELNRVYAARILNYCAKKTIIPLNDENALCSLIVAHEFNKRMVICHPAVKRLRIDGNSISDILQEDIIFTRDESYLINN